MSIPAYGINWSNRAVQYAQWERVVSARRVRMTPEDETVAELLAGGIAVAVVWIAVLGLLFV